MTAGTVVNRIRATPAPNRRILFSQASDTRDGPVPTALSKLGDAALFTDALFSVRYADETALCEAKSTSTQVTCAAAVKTSRSRMTQRPNAPPIFTVARVVLRTPNNMDVGSMATVIEEITRR
eukprot:3887185-Pleurochrysis_carterae.AAC.1